MTNENKKPITLDGLAAMVAEGFNDISGKIATKSDITELKAELKADIAQLDQGQEDIKLRLDNVAFRFEIRDLEKRVLELEKKAGVNGSLATA
jgi:hypothetical protein